MIAKQLGFACAALFLVAGSASAAPLDLAPGVAVGGGAEIVQVRGGCGFGEHRGFYGGCRINHGWRGRIRAETSGLPGGCPPGMRRGYYGRCHY